MTMTSDASVSRWAQQPGQRRRSRFLLPLHEHRHPHWRVSPVGTKCSQVRCDASLVIGGTPSIEASVSLRGLEWRRVPLRVVALGLHVVMRVEQYGWRARWRRMPGDDGGGTALADDLHVFEARVRQQFCRGIGAALHFAAAFRIGPHRLDAHQVFQVRPHRGKDVAYPLHQITHGSRLAGRRFRRADRKTPSLALKRGFRVPLPSVWAQLARFRGGIRGWRPRLPYLPRGSSRRESSHPSDARRWRR